MSKRSQKAINIITMISIVVMMVVTSAMVIVLSSMNGVSELVENIYKPFDLDITVTPAGGKTIMTDDLRLFELVDHDQVEAHSFFIEENVLLKCADQQMVATVKGVEDSYLAMTDMDRYKAIGITELGDTARPKAIMGIGLKMDLNVPVGPDMFKPLEMMAPIRGKKLSKYKRNAFERKEIPVSAAFSMNVEYDTKYVLAPLAFTSDLLHYNDEASGLELSLSPGTDLEEFASSTREDLGEEFIVKTRYQKNQLMYQTNESEKWFTFLILLFIALIGAFNIIASLTMMMIEKKNDMKMLTSIGATESTIRRIFFFEGILIAMIGTALGISIGLLICWLQQKFGLVSLEDSIVDSYPMKVIWSDLLFVFLSVSAIGLIASWIPLRSLSKRYLASA